MNAPLSWIKEYCAIDCTELEFSHRMTMTGSKVEGWENHADSIKNVRVGKILSVEKHPDADKLQVCSVDIGGSRVQIITAATNVAAGDLVPVALDNSDLPSGAHIKKGKLRGLESEGMFCSLAELCLTVHDFPDCIDNGIMQLPKDSVPGEDIAKTLMLDDAVFEFEITSNRPDCLCVSGLAREAAATFGVPFNFPAPKQRKAEGEANKLLSVRISAPELCYRYTAALVKNVRVAPSPLWMRTRLRACGVRPINNIVDITNYVMLEYNQPMHAFDLRDVEGAAIDVRSAAAGETITTLDEIERSLNENMLVIADAKKPMAVAGVMGGAQSGIHADTQTIVFESACFEGLSNRATSKALGLRTDASVRFEKGLDANNTLPALLRALELVELLGAGEVMDGIIDTRGSAKAEKSYPLNPEKINAFLGTDIPTDDMVKYLRALEFKVSDDLTVTPPTFRGDIEGFADIAEEVARYFGYDRIPTKIMTGVACACPSERERYLRAQRDACIAAGLYEICTITFLNPKAFSLLNIAPDSPLRRAVRIINPFGEETSLLRTTAIASMMDVLATNYKTRKENAALFEITAEYIANDDPTKLPDEPKKLIIGAFGTGDFYWLKGVVCAALDAAGIEARFEPETTDPIFHPGRTACVVAGGEKIGVLGELHPEIAKNYGIKGRVLIASLNEDRMFELRGKNKVYMGMPRFPAMTRDLALVCGEEMLSSQIEDVIRDKCGNLLEKVAVFDVYRGEQIAEGKKSIAYTLTLRAADRTLTDAEADACINRTLKALAAHGVSLRA